LTGLARGAGAPERGEAALAGLARRRPRLQDLFKVAIRHSMGQARGKETAMAGLARAESQLKRISACMATPH
jgi:hypothetical protein